MCGEGGGGTRYLLCGYVPPGSPKFDPVFKRICTKRMIPLSRNTPPPRNNDYQIVFFRARYLVTPQVAKMPIRGGPLDFLRGGGLCESPKNIGHVLLVEKKKNIAQNC